MRRGSNCPAVFCFCFHRRAKLRLRLFYFAFRVTGFFARIYGAGMFACGKGEEAAGMYACALLCACVWLAYHPDVLSQCLRNQLRIRVNRPFACMPLTMGFRSSYRPVSSAIWFAMLRIIILFIIFVSSFLFRSVLLYRVQLFCSRFFLRSLSGPVLFLTSAGQRNGSRKKGQRPDALFFSEEVGLKKLCRQHPCRIKGGNRQDEDSRTMSCDWNDQLDDHN